MRRATLNNWGDIVRKRVRIGAGVWIRRSNEVIPEIMGRVDEFQPGERDVEKPEICPACGEALVERGANLFCPNRDGCRPQIVARLSHFAGRDAMDIDTFSEKTAGQLVDAGLAREADQLYGLTLEALAALPRFGEKKAQNLLDALERSKTRPLGAFVYALGIPNVGAKDRARPRRALRLDGGAARRAARGARRHRRRGRDRRRFHPRLLRRPGERPAGGRAVRRGRAPRAARGARAPAARSRA